MKAASLKRLSIVIADDHQLVAEGLAATLSRDYVVVGLVSRLEQLAATIRATRPAVAIVDIVFNGESALPTLATLCADPSNVTRFVVVTGHGSGASAQAAFDAGAMGYVLKGAGSDDLKLAIDAALAGRRYYSGAPESAPVPRTGAQWLIGGFAVSAQQSRVLCELLEVGTRPQVAKRLRLTIRGVDYHLNDLRRRLGLESLPMLIRWASDHERELRSAAEAPPRVRPGEAVPG